MEKIKQMLNNLLQNKKLLWISGGVVLALIIAGIVIGILVGSTGETPNTELTGCTVTVKSEGGMPLEKLGVYIYADAARTDLVSFVKTDENGVASVDETLPAGSVAVLKDVPAGYEVAESYPITQTETTIVLPITLLSDMAPITLGGVMFDFTVTTPDGTAYTLSELLKEKKAVVLNLWYTGCQPCKAEFPYLQQAYERYGSDVEILALDPESTDDAAAVAAFKTELDLTMPMAKCGEEWRNIVSGLVYPTTIVIDRFGTVALIHKGSVDNAKTFEDAFAFFTAEDYVQSAVKNIEDLAIVEEEAEQGTAENPFEIGGVTEFEVSVEPGKTVYYNIYRISGKDLQVSSNTLRITSGETVYEPVDGKISFMVTAPDTYTPVSVAFTNTGTAAETYKVSFVSQPGSYDSPYTMGLGDFTASVAEGNEQGVYYTYTATGTGTLTVRCLGATAGVKYGYTLYNLNTYTQRTSDSEGVLDEATGVMTLSVPVNTGDAVQLIISTLPNEENKYPAADFQMEAAFENAGQGSGSTPGGSTPGGSSSSGSSSGGSSSGGSSSGGSSSGGSSSGGNSSGGNSSGGSSSGGNSSGGSSSGGSSSGGSSSGGSSSGGSSSGGSSSGGSSSGGSSSGGSSSGGSSSGGSSSGGGTTTEKTATYSVTVTDHNGNPVSGLAIKFSNIPGTVTADTTTNSSGVATATLAQGSYTVYVTDTSRYVPFGSNTFSVSTYNPNTSFQVLPSKSGEYADLYVGYAYHLSTGTASVNTMPGQITYFAFKPTQSGTYSFSISSGTLTYYGNNTAFIQDRTSDTDSNGRSFTENIQSDNIGGTYIIGIKTSSSTASVTIKRTGAAVNTRIEWKTYTGNPPSAKFTGDYGRLTIVDIAGATVQLTKGSDGYYRWSNGSIVYVDLDDDTYLSFTEWLNGEYPVLRAGVAEGGTTTWYDFSNCMSTYNKYKDSKNGVYPLTEDLKFMLEALCAHNGWANPDQAYLFDSVNGLNQAMAWMFCCYYVA